MVELVVDAVHQVIMINVPVCYLYRKVVGVRLIEPGIAGRKVHRGGKFRRGADEITRVEYKAQNILEV